MLGLHSTVNAGETMAAYVLLEQTHRCQASRN